MPDIINRDRLAEIKVWMKSSKYLGPSYELALIASYERAVKLLYECDRRMYDAYSYRFKKLDTFLKEFDLAEGLNCVECGSRFTPTTDQDTLCAICFERPLEGVRP